MTQNARKAFDMIQRQCQGFRPKLAIALGSGSGGLADHIEDAVTIPYQALAGFHQPNVQGHTGQLRLGTIKGVPVACLEGRAHYYENASNDAVKTMVRALKLLGCQYWLSINTSGSLREEVQPGSLVTVNDHINFQFNSVLLGPNDDEFGPRFLAMETLYDAALREQLFKAAKSLDIPLTEGVYISTLGPVFETPAEIRTFRSWGADLVGMSTVPEVTVAHHCGMRVAVLAVISNMAAGMLNESIDHEKSLKIVEQATEKLVRLVVAFIENNTW